MITFLAIVVPASVDPSQAQSAHKNGPAATTTDCGSLNSVVGGWVGVYGDAAATITCPTISGYQITTWWVVATLAGGSACGITGAEFRLVGSPTGSMSVTWVPDPGLTSSVGDPLSLDGQPSGVAVTLPCPANAVPGQHIVLGTLTIDATNEGLPGLSLSVVGHSSPSDPLTPFANFTRCDGVRVTMQRSDASASASAFVKCGISVPTIAYVTRAAARNTGTLSMDIVGANTNLNPMTLIARLERAAQPTVYATSVTPVSPGRVAVVFPVGGLPTGPWDLHLTTDAGTATQVRSVVLYDEAVTLARVTRLSTNIRIAASGPLAPFDSLAFGNGGQVYVVSTNAVDPGTARRLTESYSIDSYTWSPGGDRLAIGGLLSVEVPLQIIAPVQRTTGAAAGTTIFQSDMPAWSPVADRIAFRQLRAVQGDGVILTVDVAGQNQTQVTLTGTYSVEPAWSPDGKRILFRRGNQVRIVSAARGEAAGTKTVATLTNPQWGHSWSPDGRWIAYSDTRSGNADIYVRGSRETQFGEYRITTDPGDDFNPVWTRDGNGLAFVSSRSGQNNLYVATALPFRSDTDGDLVLDAADTCPAGGPPPLGQTDRNFDGCADPASSFRNMRFWAADRLPIHFEIHPTADPAITDGSDIQALASAMSTWNTATGSTAIRDTPADTPAIAVAGDGRNTMTFLDPNGYKSGFLAITVVTSVAGGDTVIDGTWYRPGEIVDADILFNSAAYAFTTPSYPGQGQPVSNLFDLQSVATHEDGHLFGLAHSSVKSSTMYYAVPHDTSFRTLSRDDRALAARTYGSPAANVSGRILRSDGVTPIPGAAVSAIGTATGDTLQMTVSGVDGSYSFWGATENFKIYVQPVDGGPEIGGLVAGSVGRDFAAIAQTDFVPEYWDGPTETNSDTGTGVVVVAPGPAVVNADVIINADLAAPVVAAFTPQDGATNVPVTTVLAAKFNDRIDLSSINGTTVQLRANGVQGVAGGAGLLQRDSLIAFTPTNALQYSTSYTFTMGPGIRDRFGNAMPSPSSATFTTEAQPTLTLTSVSPVEIPIGGILVIQGTGFNPTAVGNVVHFAGNVTAVPSGGNPAKLYVTIPAGATSGNVTVTANAQTSNALPITVVASRQPPTVSSLGNALIGNVRSMSLSAGGAWAYIATTVGVTAVDASPSSGFFLQTAPILIPGGVTSVAALGDGRHVVVLGPTQPRFRILETDLVNRTHQVLVAANLADEPLGVAALPGGDALIVHANRVVQVSTLGVNAGQEEREWTSPDVTFQGGIAAAGDGRTAYAAATDGRILILGLQPGEGILRIGLGSTAPREIAVAPSGGRFFTVDEHGVVRVGDNNAAIVKELALGGGFKSIAISPEGEIAYCADYVQNKVQVVNIQGNNLLPMTLFATGRDPLDIATGASGRYIYVLANGRLEVYDTQTGPVIKTVSPSAGGPGTHITITGTGFSPTPANNSVAIGGVAVTPISTNVTGTRLVAVQDAAATTGTVQVTVSAHPSNAMPYRVVNRANAFVSVADFPIGTFTPSGGARLLPSPDGKWIFARDPSGTLTVIVADVNSAFLYPALILSTSQTLLSSDGAMAISLDGTKLYAADPVAARIRVYSFDPSFPFLFHFTRNATASGVDQTFTQPSGFTLSPDGKYLYARVATSPPQIWMVDTSTDTRAFVIGGLTRVGGFAIHPDGSSLYISDNNGSTIGVRVVGADPTKPGFGAQSAFITTSPQISSVTGPVVASPDGTRIIVDIDVIGNTTHALNVIDSNAGSPTFNFVLQGSNVSLGTVNTPVMTMNGSGTMLYLAATNILYSIKNTGGLLTTLAPTAITTTPLNLAVSADDARLYYNGLTMAYLSSFNAIAAASPPSLLAVQGALVPGAFAVRVATGTLPGNSVDGTLVKFGGAFRQILPWGSLTPPGIAFGVADANGFVRAPQYQVSTTTTVPALCAALSVNFAVTAIADTTVAPQLVTVYPGTADHPGIGTAVVVDFSKSVRPSSVNVGSLTLRAAGVAIPAVYSLVDNNRRAIVRPVAPLSIATTYTVDVQSGILDASGAGVSNPGTRTFTTSATASPLRLLAIEPPAAPAGSPIVISGSGFPNDYTQARIRFGTTTITPVSGDASALRAYVPSEAASAPVRVVSGTDSTATRDFVVLPPGGTPVNDVIGTITAPSSGHHIAIVPDGTRSYMTCPGSGTVVPMRIQDAVAEPAIPVGVYPFGVVASPDGRWVYVTNFESNEVAIIDATPTSLNFQRVVNRFPVGANPTGIAINPNGRRVYVANYTDGTVSIVDTDSASATYLRPIALVNVGSKTQTLAITPDGARLLVGTATGILILDAENPDDPATAPVSTGTASRVIAVTPDGGYAVVLGSDGQIYLIDLSANSTIATAPVSTGTASRVIAVSPDGGEIYVTSSDGSVQVFSIVSILAGGGGASSHQRTLTGFNPLPSVTVGENPIGLAFDRRSGKLLVVNAGANTVSIINVAATSTLDQSLPIRFSLGRPVPNPFRGLTSFGLDLPSAQEVRLRIYAVDGRLVRDVSARRFPPGRHILTWDGRTTSGVRAAAGVYFAAVQAGDWREHLKIVLLR